MRFLLTLITIGTVLYGAISSNLPLVLAGACAIALLRRGKSSVVTDEDAQRVSAIVKRVLGPPWRQLLLAALVSTGIAGWSAHQSEFIRIGVYCWLAALGLVLAAAVVHDSPARPHVGASSATNLSTGVSRSRWGRFDWIAALALTVLALSLRLYQLNTYLPPVHGDEGEMGMLALLALHGPTSGIARQPLLPFGTAFLGHPTLFHYLQAFGMAIFGETITGLRIVSTIFGALCAPLLYAIGRAGWGRITGLTAGWLVAVSHLHIHFSRIALNNIETVLSLALLIWLFLLAASANQRRPRAADADHHDASEQRGSHFSGRAGASKDAGIAAIPGGTFPSDRAEASRDAGVPGDAHPQIEMPPSAAPRGDGTLLLYVLIGLVIGLGQYFYYGARLLPLLAAVLLIFLWRKKQVTWTQIAVVVCAAGVAYFPLGVHYATHLRAFSDRISGVSVFTPLGMAHALGPQATWPHDIPRLLWEQIRLNLSLFLNYGDHSSFYTADIPAFDIVTVVLFWLGLGLVLAKANRLPEFMLLAWFGLGVLLGGVLTNDAPNAPRLIVAVPAIFLVGGVFLQSVAETFGGHWSSRGRWSGIAGASAIAVCTLALNFHTYFVEYKQIQPSLAQLEIAQEMAQGAEEYSFYLLGAPNLYANYGTIRFIARAAERHDLEEPAQLPEKLSQQPADKDALIIALPHRVADLAEIERQFPGGTETARKGKHDVLLYVTYRIPAAEVRQAAFDRE